MLKRVIVTIMKELDVRTIMLNTLLLVPPPEAPKAAAAPAPSKAPPPPPTPTPGVGGQSGYVDIEVTSMRRTIAKRLTQSKV